MGRRRKGIGALMVIICVLASAAPTHAQEATTESEARPSAGEIALQMANTLKDAETVRVSAQVQMKMMMGQQPISTTLPISATYADPMKFRVKMPMYTVYGDGEKATVYIPQIQQYRVMEYKEVFSQFASRVGPDLDLSGNLEGASLTAQQMADAYKDAFQKIEVTGADKAGGVDVWVIEGEFSGPTPAGEKAAVPVRVLHRRTDGLILRLEADMSEMMKKMKEQFGAMGGQAPDEMQYNLSISDITLNAPVEEGTFDFEPPPGAEEMKGGAAGAPRPQMKKGALAGKPAPDFDRQTLEGEDLQLSELKGQVVILDFWARWCQPCMQELPHIQEFWEEVEGEGVLVIGVNQDGSPEVARQVVKDKGLTFPIVFDKNHSIGKDYRVGGIPTLVVIDTQGKVLGRYVGSHPDIKEVLTGKMAELLPGFEEPESQKGGGRTE